MNEIDPEDFDRWDYPDCRPLRERTSITVPLSPRVREALEERAAELAKAAAREEAAGGPAPATGETGEDATEEAASRATISDF